MRKLGSLVVLLGVIFWLGSVDAIGKPGKGKGHHSPIALIATNDPAGADAEADLWPPNHKMVPVSVTVDDDRGAVTAITGVTVWSNQAVDEIGSGNTAEDAAGFEPDDGDTTVGALRAERSGAAKDEETGAHLPRVYLIVVDYEYENGDTQSDHAAVAVYVPHDQGKKKQDGFRLLANQAEVDGDENGVSSVTPIPILITSE